MPHVTDPIHTIPPPKRVFERVGAVLLLAVAYLLAAKLSQVAAAAHAVVSSFWPPAGIALFALLRFGGWLWPGIALGAFAFNVTNDVPLFASLAIAAGNTLSGVVANHLLTRVAHIHRALDRVRDVLSLAGLAAVVSTLIAATIGSASLVLSETATAGFGTLWLAWWSGDAVGVLVVTPLLLTWTLPVRYLRVNRSRTPEAVAWLIAVVAVAEFAFSAGSQRVYPVFPLVTAVALRLGRRGAATAVALVAVVATWRTVTGAGPFAGAQPLANLYALQLFTGLLSVPSLLFAAARAEVLESRERLRESESQYRTLARYLPNASVAIYDRNLRIRIVEGPVIQKAGFTKEGMEGKTLWELLPRDITAPLAERLTRALGGEPDEFEGEFGPSRFLVRVLPLPDGRPESALGMVLAVDITERYASERELRESRRRLEVLTRRVLAAQEGERRRIAREIHDELGQALTGVKIALSGLIEREGELPPVPTEGNRRRDGDGRRASDARERTIRGVSRVVDGAIAAIKEIILRLRPGVLDNLGAIAAVEWEVQQFRSRSGLRTTLKVPPKAVDIDAERSIMLFRVVQEGLTNVARHAHAESVAIELAANHEEFVLRITDDGRGISDTELAKPEAVGVLGMRERAIALGGTLDLRRGEAGGTVLTLRVPLVAPALPLPENA